MAANINPQGVIGSVGRAVPLTFALATVGVLLVSYTFVRLTQKFHHSGSVYGFVGATLGRRTGVVAGWGLLGTYTFYAVVTSTAAGRFLTSFLDGLGIWNDPPQWAPFLFALLALVGVYALTVSPVRRGTRFLLTVEGLTVLLILVVSVIILAKLAARQRAGRQGGHVHPVRRPARYADQRAVPGRGVRLPVVRRLRGGRHARRGGEAPAPGHPAGDPRHRDLRRPLLHLRHLGRGDGLRHRPGRPAGVRLVRLAARRPRRPVRRQLGRPPDQPRRRGQRLRLRAGLRGRRVPAAVRARPGRRRAGRARPGPGAEPHPGRGRPGGRRQRGRAGRRSSASPTGTTSRRRSACSPTPA